MATTKTVITNNIIDINGITENSLVKWFNSFSEVVNSGKYGTETETQVQEDGGEEDLDDFFASLE